MQVILQGSLRHFPAAELLRFLGGGKHGGTLDLQSADGGRVRLCLDEGLIVFGEAGNAPDLVGVIASALGSDGSFVFVDAVVLPDGVTPQPAEVGKLIAAAEEQLARANSFP